GKGKSTGGDEESWRADLAGIGWHPCQRRRSDGVGEASRVSSDYQGFRGWWRTWNAHCSQRARIASTVSSCAVGGGCGVWERRSLHGEVCGATAAYRVPSARRSVRKRGEPGRARMLDPAAPSEVAGRIAFDADDSGVARANR